MLNAIAALNKGKLSHFLITAQDISDTHSINTGKLTQRYYFCDYSGYTFSVHELHVDPMGLEALVDDSKLYNTIKYIQGVPPKH